MNRLATLIAREQRLIEANSQNDYVTMVLTKQGLISNPKADRYTNLLLEIYREKVGIWIFKRENNEIYKRQLETAKVAVSQMQMI